MDTNFTALDYDGLVSLLRKIEGCKVSGESEPFGFTLLFTPAAKDTAAISNVSKIAEWAKANKHSIFINYREPQRALSLSLISE